MRESGYSVWYNPETQIIHHKGKSSAINIIRSRFAFYEAMLIFTRKYRHKRGGYFPEWLIVFGILFQATLNIGATLLSFTPVLIDLAIINLTLIAGIFCAFPILCFSTPVTLIMHLLYTCYSQSASFPFAYNGIYSKVNTDIKRSALGLLASLTFFASVYFINLLPSPESPLGSSHSQLLSCLSVGER